MSRKSFNTAKGLTVTNSRLVDTSSVQVLFSKLLVNVLRDFTSHFPLGNLKVWDKRAQNERL